MPLSLSEAEELELLELEKQEAAAKAKPRLPMLQSAAQQASGVLQGIPTRPRTNNPAEMVMRLGRDTAETILPFPRSVESAKRLFSPTVGEYGLSRTAQEMGEMLPSIQDLMGSAAEKTSESKLGQKFPIPTAAAGAGAYALSHLLPSKLTPREASYAIGAEGLPFLTQTLKPAASAFGKGLGRAAESISGLEYKTPGVLEAAAKDPTLLIGPGKKVAGESYDKIMQAEHVREPIARASSAQQVIDESLKALDDGSLTPQEAIVARQAVDKAKNSLPNYTFHNLRKMFDTAAKKISAEADKGYARAIMSDALRLPLPVNKRGGTSIIKSSLGTLGGVGPLLMMSPLAQGVAATGAGIAGRQIFGKSIPGIRGALANILRNSKTRGQ